MNDGQDVAKEVVGVRDKLAEVAAESSWPTVFLAGVGLALVSVAEAADQAGRMVGLFDPQSRRLRDLVLSEEGRERMAAAVRGLTFHQAVAILGQALVNVCFEIDHDLEQQMARFFASELFGSN